MSDQTNDRIHFTVGTQNNEAIIRHGQARPEVVAKRLSLSGLTINGPADWVTGKLAAVHTYFNEECYALCDREARTIQFVSNDEQKVEGGHTITGQLDVEPALDRLHINDGKKYSASQLGNLLKMNRSLFADRDENMRIVTALQQFKARVVQEVEKNNDLRGNQLHHFEQTLTSDFNLSFVLLLPIFRGQEAFSFPAEIRFEVTDGSVLYWLESVELKDLEDLHRNRILDEQLQRLRDVGITVVEK